MGHLYHRRNSLMDMQFNLEVELRHETLNSNQLNNHRCHCTLWTVVTITAENHQTANTFCSRLRAVITSWTLDISA
jgi:hypothetical protein